MNQVKGFQNNNYQKGDGQSKRIITLETENSFNEEMSFQIGVGHGELFEDTEPPRLLSPSYINQKKTSLGKLASHENLQKNKRDRMGSAEKNQTNTKKTSLDSMNIATAMAERRNSSKPKGKMDMIGKKCVNETSQKKPLQIKNDTVMEVEEMDESFVTPFEDPEVKREFCKKKETDEMNVIFGTCSYSSDLINNIARVQNNSRNIQTNKKVSPGRNKNILSGLDQSRNQKNRSPANFRNGDKKSENDQNKKSQRSLPKPSQDKIKEEKSPRRINHIISKEEEGYNGSKKSNVTTGVSIVKSISKSPISTKTLNRHDDGLRRKPDDFNERVRKKSQELRIVSPVVTKNVVIPVATKNVVSPVRSKNVSPMSTKTPNRQDSFLNTNKSPNSTKQDDFNERVRKKSQELRKMKEEMFRQKKERKSVQMEDSVEELNIIENLQDCKSSLRNFEKQNDPDEHLLTLDMFGNLKQWNVSKQKLEKNWGKMFKNMIDCMAITPDGVALFITGSNGLLKQWNIKTQELIFDWGQVHKRSIYCMVIMPSGDFMFTAGLDKHLKQWDLGTNTLFNDYGIIHENSILALSISPNEEILYSASATRRLLKWALIDDVDSYDYGRIHQTPVNCMLITPNGHFQITCSNDKTIKQWTIKTNKLYREYKDAHKDSIKCMAVSHDGVSLFTGGEDCELKKWNIEDGACVHNFGKAHNKGIKNIMITFDGMYLITTGGDKTQKQWDLVRYGLYHNYGECHDNAITSAELIPY